MNSDELKLLLDDKLSKLSEQEKTEIRDHFSEAIQLQRTANQILINSIKLAIDCGISRNEIIQILDTEIANSFFKL